MRAGAGSPSTPRPPSLQFIEEYERLGWTLTPVARGTKRPVREGWQHARSPTKDELESWFGTGQFNPGLRLGPVSDNVHDIDCDDEDLKPFLAAMAPEWAKECPTWSRGDRPHILVRPDVPIPYRKFSGPSGTLVEIRGDGHQSLLPPSIHTSGMPYEWVHGPHQPPVVSAHEVVRWAEDSVVAYLLSMAWTEGSRHDLSLAFAGWAARRGIDEDRCRSILRATCRADDPEVEDRLRAASDTYTRIDSDGLATGWPTLRRMLGEPVAMALRGAWRAKEKDGEERIGKYIARSNMLFVEKVTRDGPKEVQLANFDVRIDAEIARSDGSAETERWLRLSGARADGRELSCRVRSTDYQGMAWVISDLGPDCVAAAGYGMRESLREAIQQFSGVVRKETVYTHTGWRKVGHRQVFLHGGLEGDVRMELEGSLGRYRLPVEPIALEIGVPVSLLFFELGETPTLSALWASVFLAPLTPILRPDFMAWLCGPTGSFKSTIGGLMLCHYGEFDRKTLPADWSSTENHLERLAYLAKDVLLIIDEFAPPPGRAEREKMQAKANRLIRAQGNLAGRGRMRADTTLREAMEPRGLILATAEMAPPLSASAIARTLTLNLRPGDVDRQVLTQLLTDRGVLASAMSHYVGWIANHYEELALALPRAFEKARNDFTASGHRRTPEILANLEVAAATAMRCFLEIGGVSDEEARAVVARVREDLRRLGAEQEILVGEANPARSFLRHLVELFASGGAYLAGRAGGAPSEAEEVGWERSWQSDARTGQNIELLPPHRGERIGFADDDFIYLLPGESIALVERAASASGVGLAASQSSLPEALEAQGWLVREGHDRFTSRTRIDGKQLRVWKLRREALTEWAK